jgi:hypothetical protein
LGLTGPAVLGAALTGSALIPLTTLFALRPGPRTASHTADSAPDGVPTLTLGVSK